MLKLAGWQNIEFVVVLHGISGHDDFSDNTNQRRADFAAARTFENSGGRR